MTAPCTKHLLCLLVSATIAAGDCLAAERVVGWRGDLTGRYPDATPPTEWGRWPKSPVRSLRTQVRRPQGEPGSASEPLEFAIVRDWLVLAPFPADEKPLDREFVPREPEVQPDEGEKVGDLTWTPMVEHREGEDFGNVLMDWLPLQTLLKEKGQVAYAHAYLHSQMEGKVVFVLDHQGACKVWVNGKAAYANPKPSVSLYAMNNISWGWSVDLALPFGVAAQRISVDLAKGWNRVLFKTTGPFHLRVAAEPSVAYEEKNIVYAMDNQGNCVVFEPGRKFRQLARNQIQTQVHRDFPLNPQETLTYSSPVPDENRLYLRGEQFLYCIGEK